MNTHFVSRLLVFTVACLCLALGGIAVIDFSTPVALAADAVGHGGSFDWGSAALSGVAFFGAGHLGDINDLKRRRGELIDKMDALARGETSPETRAEFDTLEAEVNTLNEDIRRAEVVLEQRRASAAGVFPAALTGERSPADEGAAPLSATQIIGGEGDTVRALTLGQSVRSAFMPDYQARDNRQNLNLGRYFRGLVTGDWSGAETERRAMSEGVLADGGYTVPTFLSTDVIDAARNQARVFQAGALTVPMRSQTLKIARVLTDPVPGWKEENAAMAEGAMTFDPVELKAKTLAVLIKMSRELFMDSANVESVVRNALAAGLALELDRVALFGSGVGEEPRGLFNTAGIQTLTVDANGEVLTSYDPFSLAVEKVADVNGVANAAIFSPRTAGTLDRLKDSTGQPLQAPESFKNLTKLSTKQVPNDMTRGASSNASCAFVGEFPNLLVGLRESLQIEISREAGDAFSKMQIWLRAFLRADIAVARPNKFVLHPGIIPAS